MDTHHAHCCGVRLLALLTLGVSRGSGSVEEFLAPFYIGHHTPLGNFVTAWAMKDALVEWLGDEPPAPYAKM